MRLEQALAAVRFVVETAPAPVSVYVVDDHGEIVAAATMDGAAPDTRLNAQRKAYTAARSDATSTAELAAKAREDAAERASFDPFFTFFQGGVAAFEDGRRVGASGERAPGPDDDALAPAGHRGGGSLDGGLDRSALPSSSLKRHSRRIMRKRTIAVLLAVRVGAIAAIPVFAATPKFTGTVGPGFTISMARSRRRPARYTLVVSDKSSIHNFHLKGNRREREDERRRHRDEDVQELTLEKGKYTFVCDPHPTSMKGSFTIK